MHVDVYDSGLTPSQSVTIDSVYSPHTLSRPDSISHQVLPLPLSVDFLRLVLAVIDDHARAQGHENTRKVPPSPPFAPSTTTAVATSSTAGMSRMPTDAAPSSTTWGGGGSVDGVIVGSLVEIGAPAPAAAALGTASCLFSIEDLPRLYHGPGVIMRNLARVCKGGDLSEKKVGVQCCTS